LLILIGIHFKGGCMKSQTNELTLPLRSWQSWIGEIGFWALAIVVPLMGHMFHWNVRAVLPMHWVILLSGLVYGTRGGFIAGAVSPFLNTLLTGMPAWNILPAMTLEIATYGFVSGALREKTRLNSFLAVFLAIISGRLVYLGYSFLFHRYQGDFLTWAWNTIQPGLFSAVLQIVLLPIVATIIIKLAQNKNHA